MGRQLTAEQYLNYWREHETWTHLTRAKHMKRLHTCADWLIGSTFVDVGCALGHSTDIMKKRKEGDWTGIEFDSTTIPETEKLFPDIKFLYAESMEDMGTLGMFDGVVCSEVIEHVPDDKMLIINLLKITKRRLILSTPSVPVSDVGHVRLYTMMKLLELIQPLTNGSPFSIDQEELFFYIKFERATETERRV